MTKTPDIPYFIVSDEGNDHAAYKLGALQQKQHEGTLTDSEAEFMAVLTAAILDYQVSKAYIKAHTPR